MSRRVPLSVLGFSLCSVIAVWLWNSFGSRSHGHDQYTSHSHVVNLSPRAGKAIVETVRVWMANYGTNRAAVKATGQRQPTTLPATIRAWQIEGKGGYVYSLHMGRTYVTVTASVQNSDGSTIDETLQMSLAPTEFGERSWDGWRVASVYMPSRP